MDYKAAWEALKETLDSVNFAQHLEPWEIVDKIQDIISQIEEDLK